MKNEVEQPVLFETPSVLDQMIIHITALKTGLAQLAMIIGTNEHSLRELKGELRDCQCILERTIEHEINPSLFEGDGIFETLNSLIGPEHTTKVIELFEGQGVYINKSMTRKRTYESIRKDYKTGSTYRALSLRYGYTETHIRNIIHKKGAVN